MKSATMFLAATALLLMPQLAAAQKSDFVMGYFPGWVQEYDTMGEEDIAFGALTHVAHFAAMPDGDDIEFETFFLDEARSEDLIDEARRHDIDVLLTVGSGNSAGAFRESTSDANLDAFVEAIVEAVDERGYDGADIDWEPFVESDIDQYQALIRALDEELEHENEDLLLVTALLPTSVSARAAAGVEEHLDFINIMTYGYSGPWQGWVTWHSSPLKSPGTFPSTGGALPAVKPSVERFVDAGIDRDKLAIGVGFYGQVWEGGEGTDTGGVTKPRQEWTKKPDTNGLVRGFRHIYEHWFDDAHYRYDAQADAPYLSYDRFDPARDRFISYEDPLSITKKMKLVREEELAGVILWHLGLEFFPYERGRSRHPLSTAVVSKPGEALPSLAHRPCARYRPGDGIPRGFGVPYTLSGSEALLVNVTCAPDQATVIAGVGNGNTSVYETGYYWHGGTWKPMTFRGFDGSEETWIEGVAHATIDEQPNQLSYILAYTCQAAGEDAWDCGCRTEACDSSTWQLQRVAR